MAVFFHFATVAGVILAFQRIDNAPKGIADGRQKDYDDDDDLHVNDVGRGLGAQLTEQHFVDGLYPPSALFDVVANILTYIIYIIKEIAECVEHLVGL